MKRVCCVPGDVFQASHPRSVLPRVCKRDFLCCGIEWQGVSLHLVRKFARHLLRALAFLSLPQVCVYDAVASHISSLNSPKIYVHVLAYVGVLL